MLLEHFHGSCHLGKHLSLRKASSLLEDGLFHKQDLFAEAGSQTDSSKMAVTSTLKVWQQQPLMTFKFNVIVALIRYCHNACERRACTTHTQHLYSIIASYLNRQADKS